jgi:hypothetical protein
MKSGKLKSNRSRPKQQAVSSRNRFIRLATFGTVGLGVMGTVRAETVITFGGFQGDNTDIASIPNYGDNVAVRSDDYDASIGPSGIFGTPSITLDWIGSGWDTYTAWDGRGNVAQTDFNDGATLSIVFTPSAPYAVQLGSFQLDEWAGGGDGQITWSVAGATSGTLASGNWTMSNSGGRSLVSPNATGLAGEAVTLSFTLGSGAPSYFALDNLAFAQVPEPSTLALAALGALGLGAAAMRRRRA